MRARIKNYLKDESSTEIPLVEFLPPMPRYRLHQYVTPELLDGDDGPNCYSTVRTFFKDDMDPRIDGLVNDRDTLHGLEHRHYCELESVDLTTDFRFGDIFQSREGGHAVRFLLKDSKNRIWVMSKARGEDTHPLQLLPFSEAFDGFEFDSAEPFSNIHVYRRCR